MTQLKIENRWPTHDFGPALRMSETRGRSAARMSEIMVGWATAFLIFNLKDGPPTKDKLTLYNFYIIL